MALFHVKFEDLSISWWTFMVRFVSRHWNVEIIRVICSIFKHWDDLILWSIDDRDVVEFIGGTITGFGRRRHAKSVIASGQSVRRSLVPSSIYQRQTYLKLPYVVVEGLWNESTLHFTISTSALSKHPLHLNKRQIHHPTRQLRAKYTQPH